MAGRIKGITVEIGGDTTKLSKALESVNKQIKNTQSQLKDVEKLLKLDPGNTELLAQKHKLLGDAVAQTKEKLETLKTAAEQANEALARGEISQEQYDALQREILETEQDLKRLEEQANQSATALQKIAATGEKLKTVGDNISGVGEKLMPVTAGVVALGTAAVKTASDFDSAMSQVAAVSGATGDELEALRDKAREMGSKTKFSASEAAEAMNYMTMAGWKTSDMLSGIEGIMNLAAASGEDLATTSDIVTDALTAFGLTASDSAHFADVLAAASSNANTNVSMMGETFKYAAPIAGSLGFSVEDTAEAIGLMANAGIKSTQAGTSLRTIMTNLTGEVKICGASIGEVTIATTNADGSMRDLSDILADCRTAFGGLSESEKAAAAETLVGKNAMSGFLALMNAAPGDVDKLSNAIANCDGTSQSMADTMQDNLAGQLTILKSQLEELAISFGELLVPIIRSVVSAIQGFVDKLNSMDEGTRKFILTIAAVVAALGPVLIVVGKVISAVGTIMTVVPKIAGVIKTVKTAFAALNAVMLANPIVLIIAAIVALVAAFIYLWNNCEGFRQFWIDLWNGIKEAAVAAWEGIKSFFQSAWEAISSTAQTIWNGLKDFFSGLWEGIKGVFTAAWSAISGVMTSIWSTITSVWQSIMSNYEFDTVSEWLDYWFSVREKICLLADKCCACMDKLLSGKPLGSLGREIDHFHEELTQMTTGEKRYPKEDRPFEKKAALPEGLEKEKGEYFQSVQNFFNQFAGILTRDEQKRRLPMLNLTAAQSALVMMQNYFSEVAAEFDIQERQRVLCATEERNIKRLAMCCSYYLEHAPSRYFDKYQIKDWYDRHCREERRIAEEALSELASKYSLHFPNQIYTIGLLRYYPIVVDNFDMTSESEMTEWLLGSIAFADAPFDYLVILSANEFEEINPMALQTPRRMLADVRKTIASEDYALLEKQMAPYPVDVTSQMLGCFEKKYVLPKRASIEAEEPSINEHC